MTKKATRERIEPTQVMTPPWVVRDMFDMMENEDEKWAEPGVYFFEPSYGKGAFLVQYMERSFKALRKHYGPERSLAETICKMKGIELDERLAVKARMRCYYCALRIVRDAGEFNVRLFAEFMVANTLMENLEIGDFFKKFQQLNLKKMKVNRGPKKGMEIKENP